MPLIAIGNNVANAQNYTNFIAADSIELQQQQGNTDDTLKFSVWDPLSSFPIAPEDEVHLIDETDPNGWPSCNLLTNPSLEGAYAASGATGASGTFAPSWSMIASGTLSAPSAPVVTGNTGASSSFTAGQTVNVAITYVTPGGETTASPNALATIGTTGNNVGVTLPAFPAGVTSCNVYASTASGGTTLNKITTFVSGSTGTSGGTVAFATFGTSGTLVPAGNTSFGTIVGAPVTAGAIFTSTSQQLQITNLLSAGQYNLLQTVTLPVNEKGTPILSLPYTLSFYYRVTSGFFNLNLFAQIDWYASNGAYISSNFTSAPNLWYTNSWQRLSVSATAPANAAKANLSALLIPPSTGANGGTVLLDGMQFEYNTFAAHSAAALPVSGYQNPSLNIHTPTLAAPSTTALTVYTNNSNSQTPGLSGAGAFATTGTASNLISQSSLVGTATGWGQLYARGNSGAWAAAGSAGAPTGGGVAFDGTTLNDRYLVAGNWTHLVRLAHSNATGTITATILGRWYLYDIPSATYIALGTSTLAGQTISGNGVYTTYTLPATSVAQTYVGPQQRLYVDVWLNVTANTLANAALTVLWGDMGGTAGQGGFNNSVATAGYQSAQPQKAVADGWINSADIPGMVYTSGSIGNVPVQQIACTNILSYTNYLSANQSNVETDISGFYVGGASGTGQGPFVGGGVTITRDTTTAWQGTSSLKVVTDGLSTFQTVEVRVPVTGQFLAGTLLTLSGYVKASAGTPSVRFYCQADTGAIGNVPTVALSTAWQRFSLTVALPNPVTQQYIALRVDTGSVAQALTLWMDGLQIEPGDVANGWTVGGTNQLGFTRGLAQDQVLFNPLATYTVTLTYQVPAALSSNMAVRFGFNFEDINGNTTLADTAVATGGRGQPTDSAWTTLVFRIGPGTLYNPPPTTRKFKVYCGVNVNSYAPANGTVALQQMTLVADQQQRQNPNAAIPATAAGVYPTPFIDPALAGDGTHMVWYDREVSTRYYRAQRWFGGYIKHAKQNYANGPERTWDIDCVDYGALLSEALVVLVVRAAGTALASNPNAGLADNAAIAAACSYAHNQGYLQGLDWTTHVANLTTLPALSFNWQTARDVLSAICDITVGAYWIDPYKYLWYQQALTVSAPFALAQNPDLVASFPMEEWAIDYDSTQTRTTPVIQGSTQLSSPQTQTFYGYTGTCGGGQLQGGSQTTTLQAGSTYQNVYISPNSARISAFARLQIDTVANGVLTTNTSDILPTPPSAPTLTAVAGTSTFAAGTVFVSYSYVYNQTSYTGSTFSTETAPSPQASVSVTGTGQVVQVSAIGLPVSGPQSAAGCIAVNFYVSPSAGSTGVIFRQQQAQISGQVAQFNLTAYGTGSAPFSQINVPVQLLTPGNNVANGAATRAAAFTVNAGQPIYNVTGVTVNSTAQSVALASTTTTGYQCYSDPQPGLITFDPSAWPANAAVVAITYTFENPVLIRVTAPGGSALSTNGRLIAFYQNVTNIQSVQDAIDQANAILAQYGQPQAIGKVVLHWPPCPAGQNIIRGQYITITHVPSLGSSPVKFQVQRVVTKVFGNGVIRREMDLGFFRPDFATQMSQVTQDASHLATDMNASSVLNDVLSIADAYTMSDSGPTGTVGHTAVWGTNAWNDGTAYA